MLARLQGAIAQLPDAPPAPSSPRRDATLIARTVSYVATFALGAAVGHGLTRAPSPRPAPPVAPVVASRDVGAPTARPAPVAPPAATPTALPDAGAVAAPRDAAAAQRPTAPAADRTDLTAETAMIDRAHAALARGEARTALEAAEAHARRFPRGQLAENREGVAIQALVTLGRADEARARAAAFRRRWPDGLLRDAVEAAVRSIR